MINLIKIDDKEFNNSQLPILFHELEYARYFYFLVYNELSVLRFSAQSEIDPIVKEIGKGIAVGIDQSVGFWDVSKKKISSTVSLPSFFYDFYFSEKYIFIVCEVDVVILEINTLVEYKSLSFSEYIDHIELNDDSLVINFINDDIESILI
ncbi:hypothetical protein RHO15_03185 [Utexia brackfieldae]|uniref:hypothetical protein n=1 Tax=Utexia brackfieldae TaxID=3074108 RepID=UPI00370D3E4F